MDAETIAFEILPTINYLVLLGVGLYLHMKKPNRNKIEDKSPRETSGRNLEYYLTSNKKNYG